jgi:copper chaperone CopZ
MFVFMVNQVSAQKKVSELKVKTEFHCAGGKATIESEIGKLQGVKSVVADLETKVVTIQYDPAKQNQESLVAAIEKTGHKTELSKPDAVIKSGCGGGGEGEKKCTPPKK